MLMLVRERVGWVEGVDIGVVSRKERKRFPIVHSIRGTYSKLVTLSYTLVVVAERIFLLLSS